MAKLYRIVKCNEQGRISYQAQVRGWFFWQSITSWLETEQECETVILSKKKAKAEPITHTVVKQWNTRE